MATYGNGHSNGYRIFAWTDETRALYERIKPMCAAMRPAAIEEVKRRQATEDLHFGYRFNGNDEVAYRVVSNWDGDEAHLNDAIMAAFLDSASADHWYTFEKNWD